MAEAEVGSGKGGSREISLKDKGNEFLKAGNYLKAAALYTQAIKQDPSSPTLYRMGVFIEIQGNRDLEGYMLLSQFRVLCTKRFRESLKTRRLEKENHL